MTAGTTEEGFGLLEQNDGKGITGGDGNCWTKGT